MNKMNLFINRIKLINNKQILANKCIGKWILMSVIRLLDHSVF